MKPKSPQKKRTFKEAQRFVENRDDRRGSDEDLYPDGLKTLMQLKKEKREQDAMSGILIIDVEATCWELKNYQQNEIIEIGAVLNDRVFQSFVKPINNPVLSDFCKKLTSIQQKDIDEVDSFPVVMDRFIKWIGNTDYTFASWGYYDKKQFEKDCIVHDYPYPFGEDHTNIKEMFAKKYKKCGVGKALSIIGLRFIGTPHRAGSDAINISRIYKQLTSKK